MKLEDLGLITYYKYDQLGLGAFSNPSLQITRVSIVPMFARATISSIGIDTELFAIMISFTFIDILEKIKIESVT